MVCVDSVYDGGVCVGRWVSVVFNGCFCTPMHCTHTRQRHRPTPTDTHCSSATHLYRVLPLYTPHTLHTGFMVPSVVGGLVVGAHDLPAASLKLHCLGQQPVEVRANSRTILHPVGGAMHLATGQLPSSGPVVASHFDPVPPATGGLTGREFDAQTVLTSPYHFESEPIEKEWVVEG